MDTVISLCKKEILLPLSKLFGISTLERFLLEIVKLLDQGERYFQLKFEILWKDSNQFFISFCWREWQIIPIFKPPRFGNQMLGKCHIILNQYTIIIISNCVHHTTYVRVHHVHTYLSIIMKIEDTSGESTSNE